MWLLVILVIVVIYYLPIPSMGKVAAVIAAIAFQISTKYGSGFDTGKKLTKVVVWGRSDICDISDGILAEFDKLDVLPNFNSNDSKYGINNMKSDDDQLNIVLINGFIQDRNEKGVKELIGNTPNTIVFYLNARNYRNRKTWNAKLAGPLVEGEIPIMLPETILPAEMAIDVIVKENKYIPVDVKLIESVVDKLNQFIKIRRMPVIAPKEFEPMERKEPSEDESYVDDFEVVFKTEPKESIPGILKKLTDTFKKTVRAVVFNLGNKETEEEKVISADKEQLDKYLKLYKSYESYGFANLIFDKIRDLNEPKNTDDTQNLKYIELKNKFLAELAQTTDKSSDEEKELANELFGIHSESEIDEIEFMKISRLIRMYTNGNVEEFSKIFDEIHKELSGELRDFIEKLRNAKAEEIYKRLVKRANTYILNPSCGLALLLNDDLLRLDDLKKGNETTKRISDFIEKMYNEGNENERSLAKELFKIYIKVEDKVSDDIIVELFQLIHRGGPEVSNKINEIIGKLPHTESMSPLLSFISKLRDSIPTNKVELADDKLKEIAEQPKESQSGIAKEPVPIAATNFGIRIIDNK